MGVKGSVMEIGPMMQVTADISPIRAIDLTSIRLLLASVPSFVFPISVMRFSSVKFILIPYLSCDIGIM